MPKNVPQEDINALNLEVTPETATDIFKQTKKQADSVRWFEVRKLRLTASKFGLISKRKKDKESLVKFSLCKPADLSNVPAVKFGKANESKAKFEYA